MAKSSGRTDGRHARGRGRASWERKEFREASVRPDILTRPLTEGDARVRPLRTMFYFPLLAMR